MIATEGEPEPNVDPAVRFRYQELGRIAELHVQQVTGLDTVAGGPVDRDRAGHAGARGPSGRSRPTGRCSSTWPARSAGARPARRRPAGDEPDERPGHVRRAHADAVADDARHGGRLDGRATSPAAPSASTTCRSRGRRSARSRSCSATDRPVQRGLEPARSTTCGCGSACRSSPATPCSACPTCGPSSRRLLTSTTSPASSPTPTRSSDKLAALDPGRCRRPWPTLQQLLGDPEVLLGAVQSPAQRALLPAARRPRGRHHRLRRPHRRRGRPRPASATASRIAEAVRRRRRVEADAVRRLRRAPARPHAHAGSRSSGATPSWPAWSSGDGEAWRACGRRPRTLPTPAEVDAPGLWLARIDL